MNATKKRLFTEYGNIWYVLSDEQIYCVGNQNYSSVEEIKNNIRSIRGY